jgi:hypothetical protein
MEEEKVQKFDQKKIVKVITIILAMVVSTFFIMKWISPESKNLGKFIFGFGVSFASVVIIAFCIKYILVLYNQIKEKRNK